MTTLCQTQRGLIAASTVSGAEKGTAMSDETGASELSPVTDWVNDWDWLDDQWGPTVPAANHDPEAFENAHEFQLDRAKNHHVAFGLGIHRCIGSNLARLELTVSLQEWVRAFPDYELDTSKQTTWANGQVRGPRKLPVRLNR
jgi:hypothetical protein